MARILLGFRAGFPGLREGFEALGHEVVAFSLDQPRLPEVAGAAVCVVDFVDAARRIGPARHLGRRLARAGVPYLALNRDAPFNRGVHRLRLAALAWLKPFDGYASHSMQGAERYAARTLYCPNAARERIYRADPARLEAMRDPAQFRWDVSFFGNLDAERYREHAPRKAFLEALAPRLEATGLRILVRDSAGLSEADQIEIVQRSRINLSVGAGCDAGPEPSWGLPERCYGVPACGGFLLSDRRRHAAEDFAADEWADYDGLEDCVARVSYFAANHAEARAIAERAHARVAREHGYWNRAARLLDFARHAR